MRAKLGLLLAVACLLLTSPVEAQGVLGRAADRGTLIVAVVPDIGIEYQGLVFSVLSVIAWVLGRRFVRRHLAATDAPALNRRAEQYVGRRFTLSEPIVNGPCR